jgi:hypothetical protein
MKIDKGSWWAQQDSNLRPTDYERAALNHRAVGRRYCCDLVAEVRIPRQAEYRHWSCTKPHLLAQLKQTGIYSDDSIRYEAG